MLKIHRRIQLLEKERSSELLRPSLFVIQLFAGNGKYAGSILYSAEGQERIFEPDVADHPDRISASLALRDSMMTGNSTPEGEDRTFETDVAELPEWQETPNLEGHDCTCDACQMGADRTR